MTTEDRTRAADTAAKRFEGSYSCSQAVLGAVGPELGLQLDQATKVAAAFGGGMGRMGEVCGAVSGAFMALGLALGSATAMDEEAKESLYEVVREFAARFTQQHGSLLCREILGCRLDTPAGRQEARDRQLFSTICAPVVRDATDLVLTLLEEREAAAHR